MKKFNRGGRELPKGQGYACLIIHNKISPKTNLMPSVHKESEGYGLSDGNTNQLGLLFRSIATEGHFFSLERKETKVQDCIPLCYSFSQILNKIELTSFKQNFVLYGFVSKELGSQNARSIDLDTSGQLAIAKGVDFQHREDFNPRGNKAEDSTFSVSDSDAIGKQSTRIRNLKGLERQDASKSTKGFGPLAYYKGLTPSDHKESEGEELTSDEKNSYASYLASLIYDYQLKLKYAGIGLLTFLTMLSFDFAYAQETTPSEIVPLQIGQKVPDEFWSKEHLFYVNGDTVRKTLAEYKGKMLVLDFWMSGCMPCLLHQKSINIYKQKYANDLAVIMVNSKKTGIAIVNRRLFKQLFPFPILAHQVSYTQLLNVICLYYTNPQYT